MASKTPTTVAAGDGNDPELKHLRQLVGWRVDRIIKINIDMHHASRRKEKVNP